MTQQYDNTNRGTLFQNERRTEAKHPNYTGTINIKGEEFWLSAWVKESRTGKRYLSLSVNPKEEKKGVKDDILDIPPTNVDDFGDAPF